jgi:hypothetical protein
MSARTRGTRLVAVKYARSGGQADPQRLPVDHRDAGTTGIEQHVVQTIVAVHQREPFRLGQQPRRHQTHCRAQGFPILGGHARAELVDRDVGGHHRHVAETLGRGLVARLGHRDGRQPKPTRITPAGAVQSRQRLHRQVRLVRSAAGNLIALDGGRHVGQHQDEIRAAVADIAVEAPGYPDTHSLGHVVVELDLRQVTQCHPCTNRVVLGGQFDRERRRQVGLRLVRGGDPVRRPGLAGADRGDDDVAHIGVEHGPEPCRRYI